MCGKRIIIVLFFCFSYCLSDNDVRQVAESEAVLDPNGELLLKWRVDYELKKVRFEVVITKQAPSCNWFALGFSDRGELINSDECLFWTDYYAVKHYEDMHADGFGNMTRDARQNCEQFYFDPATRIIVFERLFDTCDKDDYVIEDGTVHIIWARGNELLTSSNNLCLTCTNPQDHGFIRVRLLVPMYKPKLGVTQEVAFTVNNFTLQSVGTTYWCKVMKQPEFLDRQVRHIFQFGSTITPGNEHFLHHIMLMYCAVDKDVDIPLYEGPCSQKPQIVKTKCAKVKVAWAYGASPFTYPEETGLPIGGPERSKYFMLEVHYHIHESRNGLDAGVVDSSGLILRIGERRPIDAALLELGIRKTNDNMAIPARQKAFTWTGYCIPQCTRVGLPLGGIKVFGSQLHTHTSGRAVWTRHSRLSAELPLLDKDMHYSTYFQEIRLLHEPVIVLPGDSLETTCMFNTEDRENATVGGESTNDEMCLNYIHYYPATDMEICKSSVSHFYLLNYFNFERRWNNVSIDLNAASRQNYLAIKPWTRSRVETLQSLYTEFPIDMQCSNMDGTELQGDWVDQPIPQIELPFPKLPRECPDPVTGFQRRPNDILY